MKKADKQHLDAVQSLGCIACLKIGYVDTPAEIHHLRSGAGVGQRSAHSRSIPLCPHHHRLGGHGEAFHAGAKVWQARFGTEEELLAEVESMLRRREALVI